MGKATAIRSTGGCSTGLAPGCQRSSPVAADVAKHVDAPIIRSNLTRPGGTPSVRSILTWNTHGLGGAKIPAVISKIRDKKPDAVVLTEAELATWDTLIVPEYTTFLPKVSQSTLVRSVMLVRKSLHPEQLDTPADVPIIGAKIGDTAVIGLYRQFSQVTKARTRRGEPFEIEQLNTIEEAVSEISNQHRTIYLAGDLNFDASRVKEDEYYRHQLLDRWMLFTQELGLTLLKTGNTFKSDGLYKGRHREAVLDHVYTRSACTADIRVLEDGLSDHYPVIARMRRTTPKGPVRQTKKEKNWKAINEHTLNIALLEWDWSRLLSTTDVHEAASLLKEAMVAATDISVPTKQFTTPNLNVRLKPDTLAAIRARDAAKQHGRKFYKSLRNKALSLVRRDHIQRNLERIRKDGQTGAWQIVNEITGKMQSHELPVPKGCKTNEEAANAANDYYVQKVLTLRQGLNASCPPKAVAPSEAGFAFHSTGTQGVKKALWQLPPKTALGVDRIPITAYKAAFCPLAMPIVHVVNLVIRSGQWPTEWKTAIITPGLKTGKPPLEISSYRPVALLCAISKIVERVLYNQLVDYIESQNILPQEQHGYRAGRGTHTALASMFAKIARALDRGMKVGLSAFDFSSAFDTIDPSVLDSKLAWASGQARKLIGDYLRGGRQKVVWNESTSKTNEVNFGVRQGSVLGPLLYILLTGDLPRMVTEKVEPAAQVATKLYADDTSAMSASKSWELTDKAMDEIAANLEGYADNNGLCLNKGKTQTLRIGHKDTLATDTLNVLGVELNRSGGFTKHHSKMLTDLRQRAGAIRRLATVMPRGKLLSELARSLVVGKLQCNAWITREARLNPKPHHGDDISTQRIMNDLARTLLGVKRIDHHRVSYLADRASLPTVNQVVVKGSALAAWKAENGGPLADLLEPHDGRTRGSSNNLRRPTSVRCQAAVNMAASWNNSAGLREAKTLIEAKRAANRLALKVRHI